MPSVDFNNRKATNPEVRKPHLTAPSGSVPSGTTAAVASRNGESSLPASNPPFSTSATREATSPGIAGVIHDPVYGELKISDNWYVGGRDPHLERVEKCNDDVKGGYGPIPTSNGKDPSIHVIDFSSLEAVREKSRKALEELRKEESATPEPMKCPSDGAGIAGVTPSAECDPPPNSGRESVSAVAGTSSCGTLKAALEKLTQLSDHQDQGDEDARRQILELLDHCPSLWREVGDLSRVAEAALLAAVSGVNKMMVPLLMRNRDNLKLQLLGEKPSLLVKMGVQRVIACWLFVQYADLRCAETVERGTQMSEWGRMQVQTEKRFQLALRSLELIRKIEGRPVKKVPAVASATQAETSNEQVTIRQPSCESDSQSLSAKQKKSA